MQNRIQELADQCQFELHGINGEFLTSGFDSEKFAELIINHATECVRDVLRDENSELTYAAATQVQNKIKQFFGV